MSNKGSMNHIRLCVSDLPHSASFYSVLLGYMGYRLLETSDTVQGWAKTGPAGNLQWVIVSQTEQTSQIARYERGAPGLQHIALNAESRADVKGLAEALNNSGIQLLLDPQQFDYEKGYFAVFVKDPDGIVIEYVHTPINSPDAYRPDAAEAW
jgi:glyoxylase I family protein